MKKLTKILKKLTIFMVFIAVFAFFSVGCSKNNSPNDSTTPQEEMPKNDPNNDDKEQTNDKEEPTQPINLTSYEIWENKCKDNSYSGSYLDYIKYLENDDEISTATKNALSSVLEIKTSATSGGSGVIFDIDKNNNIFVITNYHVVYENEKFTAKFYNSRETFQLEFVGGSATYDIAVLYGKNIGLLEVNNAKAATFNLNSVENSSICLALGNTELKGIKATKGQITSKSENLYANVADVELEHRFICHSAEITNGNSGGGLFNTNGEFIGITNGGLKENSTKLAIPASIVYSTTKNIIANCLKKNNQVIECSPGLDLVLNLSATNNLLIKVSEFNSTIWPDLQTGDQLLSFKITTPDEIMTKTVTNLFDLDDYKMLLVENSTIELTLKRDGVNENIIVSATYEQLPNNTIA